MLYNLNMPMMKAITIIFRDQQWDNCLTLIKQWLLHHCFLHLDHLAMLYNMLGNNVLERFYRNTSDDNFHFNNTKM